MSAVDAGKLQNSVQNSTECINSLSDGFPACSGLEWTFEGMARTLKPKCFTNVLPAWKFMNDEQIPTDAGIPGNVCLKCAKQQFVLLA